MVSNTGIPLQCLEKECTFRDSLQPGRRRPEYWQNLGSSKTRTKFQESSSKEIIGNMLEECNEKTAIAFTDGSCLGNPGPCGAGAYVFRPGHTEPVLLKHPVSSFGSILLDELIAIKLAVKHIQARTTENELQIMEKLHIFSDSQCAVGHLVLGWEANSHKATIQEIKEDIQKLEVSGVNVEISWTPGHANIKGNELADKLAKEAAEEAKEMGMKDLPPVLSLNDVKTAVKEYVKKKWQERWDISEKGRHLFSHRPFVDYKIRHQFSTKTGERIISQLRTGYVGLKEYLHKCKLSDDSLCQCGNIETIYHYLIECYRFDRQRETMRKNLHDRCGIIHLDTNLLLGAKADDEHKTQGGRFKKNVTIHFLHATALIEKHIQPNQSLKDVILSLYTGCQV